MTTAIAKIEQVLVGGNLEALTESERLTYYNNLCESLNLNPLSKPFEYIKLNGKLTLYAKKDATDQLRKTHGISITKMEKETQNGIYIVTAHATDSAGRSDVSTGAVSIEGLKGDALVNAILKAETKAKRRVTLSLGGLGFLDETEIETTGVRDITPAMKQMPVQKEQYVFDGEIVGNESAYQVIMEKIDAIQSVEDIAEYEQWKNANAEDLRTYGRTYPGDAAEFKRKFEERRDALFS